MYKIDVQFILFIGGNFYAVHQARLTLRISLCPAHTSAVYTQLL